MSIKIRYSDEKDLDDVYQLIQTVGQEQTVKNKGKDIFHFSDDVDIYKKFLVNSPCVVAVTDEGNIIGSCLMYCEDEDIEGVYEAAGVKQRESVIILETYQVLSKYRGQGIGQKMIKSLLARIWMDYKTVIATASPDNRISIKILESLKFKKTGEAVLYGGKKRYIYERKLDKW